MPKKLELLQNHGLIKNLDDVPGRKVITLTELGNKYASTLCNLEKMSGGSVEEFKWGVLKSMMDGAEKRAM
jgi:DNA-binding PadR family transcriptional regulator